MSRISFLSISLAAKCRILFGLAVLLIITAALFVPWLRMRDLVHEANVQTTRFIGQSALAAIDLGTGNWQLKQQSLELWWPNFAAGRDLVGPVPRLFSLSDPFEPKPPATMDSFEREALQSLIADPSLMASAPTWSTMDGEIVYRLVFPVRSTGGKYAVGTLLGVVSVEHPAVKARANLLVNFGLSLMAGALAGILAVLVFYLITQKLILSPVRELTRVAESVSQGDHNVRSQIATGDEYEELSRAFNAMMAHLQSSENELRMANKSLDTRLGDLAEKNVELFQADKVKGQFIANVSHELRTPLTSIIGFAELLREATSAEGGRASRYAENIVSSGRMLLGLINDLLDLAKIDAGKLELHMAKIDLAEMGRNLIDFMRPLADKKNLQLVSDFPETLGEIPSDPGRLQQILYNLLSNALKFTPEGGLVELKMGHLDDENIFVKVRDTGIGIPAEQLTHVFERFSQLDGSMTREYSGTGLGLSISKELVEILGGRIEVASELGRGSEFTVILPKVGPTEVETRRLHSIRLS